MDSGQGKSLKVVPGGPRRGHGFRSGGGGVGWGWGVCVSGTVRRAMDGRQVAWRNSGTGSVPVLKPFSKGPGRARTRKGDRSPKGGSDPRRSGGADRVPTQSLSSTSCKEDLRFRTTPRGDGSPTSDTREGSTSRTGKVRGTEECGRRRRFVRHPT